MHGLTLRHSGYAAAAAGLLVLATLAAVMVGRAWQSGDDGAPAYVRSGQPFSLGHPGGPFAQPIALNDAERGFRRGIVLPTLPRANRANVGAVWGEATPRARRRHVVQAVDVVFPRAGVAVEYARAVYKDALDNYRGYASDGPPGAAGVIDLEGTPALLVHWHSGDPYRNPGSVEFVAGGVRISVIGRVPDAFLKAVAPSIRVAAASR